MIMNSKPLYQRIMLKLSGESLQGAESFGIDANIVDRIAQELKDLVKLGVQVGVVIGGGNLCRGASLAGTGINRVVSDHIGMLATVMNGLAMRDSLHRAFVKAHLMSAIPLNSICENYSWAEAISMLCDSRVVIFAGGTGNPFFTTDSAACLRGIEIEAEIVLKATKVDGIYSADPVINSGARLFDRITYQYVLEKELKIMDSAAFGLARDHNLPIRVFNVNNPGALLRAGMGEKEGTLVCNNAYTC
ncbi:UMP kinase [Candidatus Profftia tarda]|uniref:Uridylate kinase n=1 Tax=Candidatus Profftia tarda TaxID=1177216 RepID=A0A8E4GHU3_9ENTR|nr:UMP kinase [Candidatus Profftia tarda]CAD6510442.1 Uridylate kinase [Candidatus Profftia tarda]